MDSRKIDTLLQILSDATTVSTMSLRYTLARCKEKKNHSKSAHISQRSFLYGGEFSTKQSQHGTQKDEKTTDKRRKNEKRHNIRWMKG